MVMSFEEFIAFKPQNPTYALLGCGLNHSVSHMLHKYLFSLNDIEADYIRVEIHPYQMEEAMNVARDKLKGFSVTMPYKVDIVKYLDNIDNASKKYYSTNTIKIQNGFYVGYNTDIVGFETSLQRDKISLINKNVAILGCGGVSRIFAHCCARHRANLCIYARDADKGSKLAKSIQKTYNKSSVTSKGDFSVSDDTDIIINGTSVGMYPDLDKCLLSEIPNKTSYVFDAIYNPVKTRLAKHCENNGIIARNGLFMLVVQAAKSQEIWNNVHFSQFELQKAYIMTLSILAKDNLRDKRKKSNIAFIGFMASGKSLVAKNLSTIMGDRCVDTDKMIERKEKMAIHEIFRKNGQDYFRERESMAITHASKCENCIIATGGGSVLNHQNMEALKENSVVVFLKPPFDEILMRLKKQEDHLRPLILNPHNEQQILEIYLKRIPVYEKYADITVNAYNMQEIIERILMDI